MDKVYQKRVVDVPDLEVDDWKECLGSYVTNMISSRDRFIQPKFLHRVYFTPQRLAAIYPSASLAFRCQAPEASFFLVVSTGPVVLVLSSLRYQLCLWFDSRVGSKNLPIQPY